MGYSYRVQISNCTPAVRNQTETAHDATITGLIPGTRCSFTVYPQAENGIEGEPRSVYQYTKPLSVTNLQVQTIGTTNVSLTWDQPDPKDWYMYVVTVTHPNGTQGPPLKTVKTSAVLGGLTSGSNHTFTVSTEVPDGTVSAGVSITLFTRPYPISSLNATTINTTVVFLRWDRPLQYQMGYSYRVQISNCTPAVRNQTETAHDATITGLNPGTRCSFTVYPRAENGIEGEPRSVYQYTKPATVSPAVSNEGTNDTITVTWKAPPGNVESYKVNLTSEDGDIPPKKFNSSARSYSFIGLKPGEIYTAVVTTVSGPFAEDSKPVSNATYPNPPGALQTVSKTTGSISISWDRPPNMETAIYSFIISAQPHLTGENRTSEKSYILENLISGTPYNISVVTEGPMGYRSTAVTAQIYTRPESVQNLRKASTTVDNINIKWNKPVGHKQGYSYNVVAWNSSEFVLGNKTTQELTYQLTKLVPGTRYNFSVTTQTSDGTTGSPVDFSTCTKAFPVSDVICEGPNRTEAKLSLTWDNPHGSNEGFRIKWSATENITTSTCKDPCSYTINELSYYTNYHVEFWTLGCGDPSIAYELICRTGITNPPTVTITKHQVTIVTQTHNMFRLKFNASLLDGSRGPVVAYAILVTSSSKEISESDLRNTYEHWKKNENIPYLAVMHNIAYPSRNYKSEKYVDVGSGGEWEGYYNGPLRPKTKYRFALVMFTQLKVQNGLVDVSESLFSISVYHASTVDLPQSPAVIGGAVGGVMAALCVLMTVTIILAIYWRRTAKKDSADIPIQSMRGKCSIPIQVEEYEEYYKKQRADSNCGFAEEYEDLKTVGVAQSKLIAEAFENKGKNRYSNVLPYDSSRVKLSTQGSPHDDYINANYIPGYNSKRSSSPRRALCPQR
ncbi:hypothetical protein AGOR_G00000950 [Albula goreensis]|uniref:protein-tyrosine-phosphatase n=1 Tax=Albula goreensis TaxID=1534307 RepID=A0A8T3E8F1_9TELE|nr:hypothetical protein AGOR_G00000950 [Albula goreensis]